MKEILGSIKWEEEMNLNLGVNELWKIFTEKYYSAEKECIPTKTVYVDGKKSKKLSVPLDRKNLLQIKKKNRLWSKKRKSLATEEETIKYNQLRNQIRRLTRKAKKMTERTIANNAKTNPKMFWKYSQSKLKTRANIPDLEMLDESGKVVFAKDDKAKADQFQSYFGGVYTSEPDGNMPPFDERLYDDAISELIITDEMVLKKLKKMKINKSPGPDQIHPRVINEIAPEICEPLKIIFQKSLDTKTLPDEWKHAQVTAIYKKGAKTQAQNYRPVSLTCILCKILESIVRDQIINHMVENNLFSPKQFGFISGRSTTLQLLHVLNIWTEILDQGGELDVIYCDFMKAFDKVPHKRLTYKIEKYGIKGCFLGWISDFLSNRTQVVKVGTSQSNLANVTSGIPQGSVLGPLLFVIYINDLPKVVDKGSFVYLFADDTKVFRKISSQTDRIQLQKDIDNLSDWSDTWLLKFHPDKCVAMNISNKSPPHNNSYSMNQHILKNSNCEKDIGVFIDSRLKFDDHITQAVNKANRVLAITKRTFECMDDNIFNMIFKGLVRPHLEYAAPVWSPNLTKHIEIIENVQRRATKLVPGLSRLPYPERLKKLKLPTLAFRRARGDMIQVYKLLTTNKDGYDKTLPCMFKFSSMGLRGHDKKLFLPGVNRNIRKYNFTHRIIKIWNSLPENVVNASNMIQFEKRLDLYWQNQDLKYENHLADIAV